MCGSKYGGEREEQRAPSSLFTLDKGKPNSNSQTKVRANSIYLVKNIQCCYCLQCTASMGEHVARSVVKWHVKTNGVTNTNQQVYRQSILRSIPAQVCQSTLLLLLSNLDVLSLRRCLLVYTRIQGVSYTAYFFPIVYGEHQHLFYIFLHFCWVCWKRKVCGWFADMTLQFQHIGQHSWQ